MLLPLKEPEILHLYIALCTELYFVESWSIHNILWRVTFLSLSWLVMLDTCLADGGEMEKIKSKVFLSSLKSFNNFLCNLWHLLNTKWWGACFTSSILECGCLNYLSAPTDCKPFPGKPTDTTWLWSTAFVWLRESWGPLPPERSESAIPLWRLLLAVEGTEIES